MAKKLTITTNSNVDLEGKNVKPYIGIEEELICLGTFTIDKPNNKEVKQTSTFVGYDYMKKFEAEYKDNNIYPIRLDSLLQSVCNQVGVQLGSNTIANGEYMVLGNPFTNGESCKTVLSNIAQLAGGFARISSNDHLYIKTLDITGNPVETLDGNNYTEFEKSNTFGAVNSIKIQMNSGVDGEESVEEITGLPDEYRHQISIINNYFLINEAERKKVIKKIYNTLNGLTYTPFESTYYGFPYLEVGDKIKVKDTEDNEYSSYVLSHTIGYNGGFTGKIKTTAVKESKNTTENTTNNLKNWRRNTELTVNKIDGKVTTLIEEQSQYEDKLSMIEQTVDSINSNVGSIIDYKRELCAINQVKMEDCKETNLYGLNLKGIKEYNNYLYPSNNLYAGMTYPNVEVN